MKKIIAVVGMCGSGKSIASDFYEERGFQKVHFGAVTLEKVKEANLEITPENEKMIRENIRRELGMGAFAKILLPRILEYSKVSDVVLDGLYSWDELKILREVLGDQLKVLAIVSDRELRYDRLSKREVRSLTRDQAIARDIAEIENSAKGGPIAFADYYIDNNGDLESYKKRLLEILEEI